MELHKYLQRKKKNENNSCHNTGGDRLGRAGAQTRGKKWQAAVTAGARGWQRLGGEQRRLGGPSLPTAHGPGSCLQLQALDDKDLPLASFISHQAILT